MKNRLLGMTLGLMAISAVLSAPPVMALENTAKTNWNVEIRTRTLPHFHRNHASLKSVEELRIAYAHAQDVGHPLTQPQEFENFWYQSGRPLAMERKHTFDITQGDGVSINLKFPKHNDVQAINQYRAAAQAILRVSVDCYLNKNALATVVVPAADFDGIQAALQDEGCVDYTTGDHHSIDRAINFVLQAQSNPKLIASLLYI